MQVKTAVGLTGVVGLPICVTLMTLAYQWGYWDEQTHGKLTWVSIVALFVFFSSAFGALFCFLQLTRWPTMDPTRQLGEPIEKKSTVSVVDVDVPGPLPTEPSDGLYGRYLVLHSDGTKVHPESFYFVLRLDDHQSDPIHRKACHAAAWAYCQMVNGTHLDKVGVDLMERISADGASELLKKIGGHP